MDEKLRNKLKLDTNKNVAIIKAAKKEHTAFDGYDMLPYVNGTLMLAFAYVYSLEEMKEVIMALAKKSALEEKGMVYLMYPKNKNPLGHPAIHRDSIFPFLGVNDEDGYVPGTEYKFNRMVALDDNYTAIGLKFLPRSKEIKDNRPSSRVNDYVDKIPDIEKFLAQYPSQLAFYQGLTPGYKKEWARYVYSAKKDATIAKRLSEMVEILGQGFKTKHHYKDGKK